MSQRGRQEVAFPLLLASVGLFIVAGNLDYEPR